MNKRRTKSLMAYRTANPERGFSIIELLVVIGMLLIISAIAIIHLQPTLQQFRANAGLDQLKVALRQARETAISQRRTIVVKFVGNNTIQMYQMVVTVNAAPPPPVTVTEAITPFNTVVLEGTVQFLTYATETDTPDAYVPGGLTAPNGIYTENAAGAVVIGGPTTGMQFQSDGTFTDGNGNPINCTVFIGVPNINSAARAATVLGGTGRVRAWTNNAYGWLLQ